MVKPISVHKLGATIQISDELFYADKAAQDPRYTRRYTSTKQPPTAEAWERYRAAVAGLAAFEAYEGSMYGGPDYGNEVPEPEPVTTFEFLETAEEWLERCRALDREARA